MGFPICPDAPPGQLDAITGRQEADLNMTDSYPQRRRQRLLLPALGALIAALSLTATATARSDTVAHKTLASRSVSSSALLFYNRANGQFATGMLGADGSYRHVSSSEPGAFSSWTNIVGAGNGALLFYNRANGQFATGMLGADGSYRHVSSSEPGAFSSWTNIAGAGNGALLFYNRANGQFATGMLGADGSYRHVSSSEPGAFSSWTNIVGRQG
jgi:hypothetical protein